MFFAEVLAEATEKSGRKTITKGKVMTNLWSTEIAEKRKLCVKSGAMEN